MAVGDIIAATHAAGYSFQPAATVEVILLVTVMPNANSRGLTDGVNAAAQYAGTWATANNFALGSLLETRFPITNTVYYISNGLGGHSGIQIK